MDSMKLFWGLVVIFAGVVLMGINLNYWSADIWWLIVSLWPVILIAIGLKLIVKNDRILGFLLFALVLGSAIFVSMSYNNDIGMSFNQIERDNKSISEDITDTFSASDIKKVQITVNTGAAQVNLRSFSDTEGDKLYQIKSTNMGKLKITKTLSQGTAIIKVSEESPAISPIGRGMIGARYLEINLPKSLLLDFNLESGASKLDLDFSNLQLVDTRLNIGASSGNINLSDRVDRQNLNLDAGASKITFFVPEALGVKAVMEGGLNNISSDDAVEFTQNDDVYTSTDFVNKAKQILISGSTGVSAVRFECACAE